MKFCFGKTGKLGRCSQKHWSLLGFREHYNFATSCRKTLDKKKHKNSLRTLGKPPLQTLFKPRKTRKPPTKTPQNLSITQTKTPNLPKTPHSSPQRLLIASEVVTWQTKLAGALTWGRKPVAVWMFFFFFFFRLALFMAFFLGVY